MNPATHPSTDPVLKLSRVLAAPRPLVFQAWTRGEHLRQWCAPHGFTIPVSEGDLRPGGAWRACMVKPDGKELWLGGVYREIVENELLVFTHIWDEDDGSEHETLVTVRLADHPDGTELLFEQSHFRSVESRDNHEGGWTECFQRLTAHLTQAAGNPSREEAQSSYAGREFVFDRTLNASPAEVFQAWTDAARMAQWFGPREFTVPVCELDARPEGAIWLQMQGPDGTLYPMTGTFQEVAPPERLVFLSAVPDDEGQPIFQVRNTVTLAEADGKTALKLQAEIMQVTDGASEFLDGMEEGWSQTLDRLGEQFPSAA